MKMTHPKGLYFLSMIEMWERFSYYGMRALLTLYMVKFLLFSTEKAGYIYGLYTGLVYATPLVGGYIADRYLGTKKCIMIGAIIMALGHFLMAVSALPFFYTALGLLIIGNGFFKPNISTTVGRLYEENDHRRDSGFTIFYMGINLGALLSPLICGTLGEKIGFHYGFGVAGVGMVIGLLIYLWGQKKYLGHIGLEPIHCQKQNKCDPDKVNLDIPLSKEDKHKIAAIFILMFFTIFFWASFEQAGSSLTLFADQSTNRIIPFFNWEFPVSYFQSVNPLLIIILAPLFSSLWINLAKTNKDPSTPVKFTLGLALISIGFFVMAFAASLSDLIGKVGFVWLICVYFFHTLGELCLSPVGLSVVTKLSPAKFASLLMGVWFLSSFFANYLSGIFAGSYDSMNHTNFFLIPAIVTGCSAIVLIFLIKPLKKLMHGLE
jgi:POT family proton-dependent oligopeptide transporter